MNKEKNQGLVSGNFSNLILIILIRIYSVKDLTK
jgi:hypothetical protein